VNATPVVPVGWHAAVLLVAALAVAPSVLRAQDIGTVAPDFSAPYVADSTAPPWHFSAREPVPVTILSFWATWCKPCETLHPWMEAVARTYASRGVRVVTINMREPVDSIRRWLDADTGSVTLDVRDPDGHITELYAVTSVPTTLLIAENNVVVRRWEGVAASMSGIDPVMNRLLAPATTAARPATRGCTE
jgi:thiol-disulfide isomerase/thioredoxin